jgi:hypothetical protein
MISESLRDMIEREGKKKGFYISSAGGEFDEKGEFIFVIKLKETAVPPALGVSVTEKVETKDKPGN